MNKAPGQEIFDFNFLAPCPASGLIVQGKKDDLVPPEETSRLAEKLKSQKNITIDYEEITGANHFYDNETSELIDIDSSEVVIQKIPKAPNGKKIKNVEVFINLKN